MSQRPATLPFKSLPGHSETISHLNCRVRVSMHIALMFYGDWMYRGDLNGSFCPERGLSLPLLSPSLTPAASQPFLRALRCSRICSLCLSWRLGAAPYPEREGLQERTPRAKAPASSCASGKRRLAPGVGVHSPHPPVLLSFSLQGGQVGEAGEGHTPSARQGCPASVPTHGPAAASAPSLWKLQDPSTAAARGSGPDHRPQGSYHRPPEVAIFAARVGEVGILNVLTF